MTPNFVHAQNIRSSVKNLVKVYYAFGKIENWFQTLTALDCRSCDIQFVFVRKARSCAKNNL